MAKCKALTGSAVKGLMQSAIRNDSVVKSVIQNTKNVTNRAKFVKKLGNFMLSVSKRHDLSRNTVLQNNS